MSRLLCAEVMSACIFIFGGMFGCATEEESSSQQTDESADNTTNEGADTESNESGETDDTEIQDDSETYDHDTGDQETDTASQTGADTGNHGSDTQGTGTGDTESESESESESDSENGTGTGEPADTETVTQTETGTETETETEMETDTGSGTGTDIDTEGSASVKFEPVFGSYAKLQFPSLWKQSIPGYDSDGVFVLMLCRTDDPSCESPVVIHEVTADEFQDSNKIGNSWGPEIIVGDLPAGDWQLMVVYDSGDSRSMGFGWDDGFSTGEKDWGGLASEADLMLADPTDHPDLDHNPAAKAMTVTLIDGHTININTTNVGGLGMRLPLEHYHQRDISPHPNTENGVIVTAVDSGARVIDLSAHSVKKAGSFGGVDYYDFAMVGQAGEAVDGWVCGMTKGPQGSVFLLYLSGTTDRAGFAVAFNPKTGEQVSRNVVSFPGAGQDFPCRGHYHEYGGNGYLWVSNVAATTAEAEPGFWYANVTDLEGGDIEAGYADNQDDPFFSNGVHRIEANEDTLYLASDAALSPCGGYACAFAADYDATTGKPTPRKTGGEYIVLKGGLLDGDYTNAAGNVGCSAAPPTIGMTIAPFHDGRDLLFIGTCLEVSVFDLTNGGAKLDFNGPAAGTPGLDGVYFGQGLTEFSLSPDGGTLWAVPAAKSLVHFCALMSNGQRTTINRHMFMPIDLSQDGAGTPGLPGIDPAFNQKDLDENSGKNCTSETYASPANDPGLDLDFFYLKKYLFEWNFGIGLPTSTPVGPSMAAADKTIWLRGSGTGGASGLANQGHLGVFDLAEQKVVLHAAGDDPFYMVWTGGTDTRWGFDLTPESTSALSTHGLMYLPL